MASPSTRPLRIPTSTHVGCFAGYLRFSHGYQWLLLICSLFGFAGAALQAMLPNVTYDVLGGGSTLYGILLGAFGAGALAGGLTRAIGARLLARGWCRTPH